MVGLLQDIRYGFRRLWRSPGFAAVTVITLALGIGANTAIFSVMDVMLLKALPIRHPEDLVEFVRAGPDGSFMTNLPPAVFEYLRRDSSVLTGTFAFISDSRLLHSSSGSEPIVVHEVSDGFFPMLGVSPLLGRVIDVGDEGVDADKQAVVLRVLRRLVKLSRDDAVSRWGVATALGRLSEKAATPEVRRLVELTRDDEWQVREEAAEALADLSRACPNLRIAEHQPLRAWLWHLRTIALIKVQAR